jgi:DNA-binding NarL/FixJ family response regulator
MAVRVTSEVPTRSALLGRPLTWREHRVIAMIAEGHTYREIGEALHVAECTVKQDTATLRDKLGARNRAHAVAIMCRMQRRRRNARRGRSYASAIGLPTTSASRKAGSSSA